MRRCNVLSLILVLLLAPGLLRSGYAEVRPLADPAAITPFKKYNPDIDKYAFAKSFILSVSYYKRVFDRLKTEETAKAATWSDQRLILQYIEDRTLDNTELRIARNYLTKFVKSQNGLVQKVSRQAIAAYEKSLALSIKERELWQVLYRFKGTGQPADFDEPQFIGQHLSVVAERKEADKQLLSASMLVRVILLSAVRCDSEECKDLALTKDERRKLTGYLDDFARDNMAWGIKAGQSPVEGCVAALREVLEDQLYVSSDQ
ncbi:MAG: hypothetical protein HQL20_04415 [Candidatus Omnitrophica bacterium]|nr:hypothetical protein [Candidatus Omnitrophota bacterium]